MSAPLFYETYTRDEAGIAEWEKASVAMHEAQAKGHAEYLEKIGHKKPPKPDPWGDGDGSRSTLTRK